MLCFLHVCLLASFAQGVSLETRHILFTGGFDSPPRNYSVPPQKL